MLKEDQHAVEDLVKMLRDQGYSAKAIRKILEWYRNEGVKDHALEETQDALSTDQILP